MKNVKGFKYLVDFLLNNDFDTFFVVTGGAIVPVIDYIGTNKKAKYYCFQHEQSAAMAAESFYRVSGKMAIVLTTSGPGAQNLLNGICGCWYESIPCLFITGQVSTYESIDSIKSNPRQVGFQETPVVESFKYFTKFSKQVTNVNELKEITSKAISSCFEERPGPSLIDLPVDVQNSLISYTLLDKVEIKNTKYDIIDLVTQAAEKLKNSKRPLFLLGHGVKISGANELAKEMIEFLNCPFVVSWGGFDNINHDHPNFIGDIGVYGHRGANFAIQNCDLLISIGSRLDTRQTGGSLETFSRDSFKIMVDIDKEEVFKDRGVKIDIPVVCDAKVFIKELILKSKKLNISNEWKKYISGYKNYQENRKYKKGILSSYQFLNHLNTQLSDDAIIIPDEGGNLVWTMQSIKIKGNQKLFSNFGNSSMGYALPSAIGASLTKSGPVICIDGDGGFQMNIQELQTIAHYNLPIKIFILNNQSYGIIKQFQDSYFGKRYIATDGKDYSAPDFSKIAKAYGIDSFTANYDNFKEVCTKVLKFEGPVLVDVLIDKEQKLVPKLEYGNPLEDMSPYQTDKEIKNNMITEMIPRRDNTQGWVILNK